MYVTKTMKAHWPTPKYSRDSWVELTEALEALDQSYLPKGSRGVVQASRQEQGMLGRGVNSLWEYTIQFSGGLERHEISEDFLKAVPWLVQLALAAEDAPT